MKYILNYEVITNVANKVSVVADKDASMFISFGAKDLGDKVLCGARTTTAHEQIMMQFTVAKPEGYTGTAEEISVKASMFTGVILNLSALKSDIFIDIKDGTCVIGIEGKAEVPVPLLAESTSPMATGKPLYNLTVKGSDFLNFLKAGLLFSTEGADSKGLSNSILAINTVTGELTGISTDQYIIGYSVMSAQMTPGKNAEAEKEAFASYCKERNVNPEEAVVLLPRATVDHLKNLITGADSFKIRVDDKHIEVLIGNAIIFTAVQGATLAIPVSNVKEMLSVSPNSRASVDSGEMEKGITFVNSMSELTTITKETLPVRLTLSNGFIKSENATASGLNASIKVASSEGDAKMCVNGRNVKIALSSLRKGGVIVGFSEDRFKMLTLANGNLSEGEDGKAKIGIIAIKDIFEADAAEESEDATEE